MSGDPTVTDPQHYRVMFEKGRDASLAPGAASAAGAALQEARPFPPPLLRPAS